MYIVFFINRFKAQCKTHEDIVFCVMTYRSTSPCNVSLVPHMLNMPDWFAILTMMVYLIPKHEVFSCYSRTFLSIIGGVVAGIWGFTGLTGFVFYFLIMMIASIGLLAKSKFSVQKYFDSWTRISIEGVFGGLMVSLVYCHVTFCCLSCCLMMS
jgi:hypothetical protein